MYIGNNSFIHGKGSLVLKDNPHISRNGDETVVKYPVKVEVSRNVWVGVNECVLELQSAMELS